MTNHLPSNPQNPAAPLGLSQHKDVKTINSRSQEYQFAQVCRMSEGSILLYDQYVGEAKRKISDEHREKLHQAEKFGNDITQQSRKKIRRILHGWLYPIHSPHLRDLAPHHPKRPLITFVTLTLVARQMHDDNWVKRNMLNVFLQWLRDAHDITNYFWRAEKQKNGNIHFHILTDKAISWRSIRTEWNSILMRHGYIDKYREEQEKHHANGFKFRPELAAKWPREAQLKAYHYGKSTNWTDPNSTDIHKLTKIKNVTAYVIKYCAKAESEENRVEGRKWSCSESLTNLNYYSEYLENDTWEMLKQIESEGIAEIKREDNYTMYIVNVPKLLENYPSIWLRFHQHHLRQFYTLYPLSDSPPPPPV